MNKDLSDNLPHVKELCARLNIGIARQVLRRVYGGFHHKMWRLETDRGSYAIKQLSPDTDLRLTDTIEHYNVTEAIAETFSEHDISAVFALNRKKTYLQLIEGIGYLVYPWTDAVAVGKNEITEKHVDEIAFVLAKMHSAKLIAPQLKDVVFDSHSEEKILLLVGMAVERNVRNARALKEQLRGFLDVARAHRKSIHILEKNRVVSHGDLDHKNVLWSNSGKPVVIDWESARRLNPSYEALLEALDWSGITATFQHGLFEKFISSYKDAGGVIESSLVQAAFDCILGDWLNWMMYNVGRAIDLEDAEQHSIGIEQIDLALSTILRLKHLMPRLLSIARGEEVVHV